jgi:hypothetical protein
MFNNLYEIPIQVYPWNRKVRRRKSKEFWGAGPTFDAIPGPAKASPHNGLV